MRILIVTDAWYPQIKGVVRTLTAMRDQLTEMGDEVHMLAPDGFKSVPCPTYPEIRLALAGPGAVAKVVDGFLPCAIHIATEGPLSLADRVGPARLLTVLDNLAAWYGDGRHRASGLLRRAAAADTALLG